MQKNKITINMSLSYRANHFFFLRVQANCFGCDANIFVVTVGEITNSNYLFPLSKLYPPLFQNLPS